jgi:inosine-uridine preferring nucleoside hydrolase
VSKKTLTAMIWVLSGAWLSSALCVAEEPSQIQSRIPVIHITDLFRPHNDPDDHWDLACVYALALQGEIDLRGIVIDSPPARKNSRAWNPDVQAVAQMNHLTGLTVPVVVGCSEPMKSRDDTKEKASPSDLKGVRLIINILRESSKPVVINITGCCRDVAIAGKRESRLFAEKCAGIYLNAGTGSPNPKLAARLEYNVSLEPGAYAAIFDLPCPVYWMPCFEEVKPFSEQGVREYGTFYRFRQNEILPQLSEPVQKYFAYMFARQVDTNWRHYLQAPKAEAILRKQGTVFRNMWCTGGFLHVAGKTVSREGRIVAKKAAGKNAVFTFDPIQITCSDKGVTQWSPVKTSKNRYIFHVRDVENYQTALTKAMKTLLIVLP